MPKHIVRLIMLLAAIVVVYFVGRAFLTPKSFYVYGHFRGASPREIASIKPTFLDPTAFKESEPAIYATWSTGIHKVVPCQDCHVGAVHEGAKGPIPRGPFPKSSLELCTQCHQKIVARPGFQPQINVALHAHGLQCVTCHNPHSPTETPFGKPLFTTSTLASAQGNLAAGQKLSAQCAACHGAKGVSTGPAFPNLACQSKAYLVTALTEFQKGTRSNPIMSGVAKGLSNADKLNLATYFSSQKCGGK
ncbi:MAG: multiheme c-type cytochrome [Betaproteobacteria bacterium]|nr:multiheme c-type cytochrome [Betaproteobacteria bacterium]